MEILDGRKIKLEILNELKEKISKLERRPGLVVIQVGSDPASQVYVKQKANMADIANIDFEHIKLDEGIEQETLLDIIYSLNRNSLVNGILVQMPLPVQIDAKVIQNAIDPLKDVDGLTDINMGKLSHNVDSLVPCTPMGIIDMLKFYNIDINGKCVTIVGRSDLVGKPLSCLMTNNNATTILCHSKTNNLSDFTRMADILVSAVGKPKFITSDMVKDDSVVIDVGINRLDDGKLCGDIDYDNVKEKSSYITPVPGGVGQMTVAELGKNTYKAYLLQKKK